MFLQAAIVAAAALSGLCLAANDTLKQQPAKAAPRSLDDEEYNNKMDYPKEYEGSASTYDQYNGDPFAWDWDHEHKNRHDYNSEAQGWIYDNMEPAWGWAVGVWEKQNDGYHEYGNTCGYTGNAYNTTETRNARRAQLLVLTAQWLWDNYPHNNKRDLIPAMLNMNPRNIRIHGIQDCLAENHEQYLGSCERYQKYSRPDQICNNIAYPTWGAWLDIGVRITDIWNYDEGIWLPTINNVWPAEDGSLVQLIDAKILANKLDTTSGNYGQCFNFDVTMLHAYFTQFITHDIIKSAPYTVTGYNGDQVKPVCCLHHSSESCAHHSCDPYRPSKQEASYTGYEACEEYSHNLPGVDYCTPLPKDPTNLQTAYIDASQLYGASCYEADYLRSFQNGKLRARKGYNGGPKDILLPEDDAPDMDECDISFPDGSLRCLKSGDKRVNQHPGLVALHTLWLRLHNKIATSCAKWMDKYNVGVAGLDEICYQETRRVIQAITQNIFYRDHLPVELGPYLTSNPNYGLGLSYVLPYDESVHASAWPEYVYAAGRLHTIVSHWAQMVDPAKADKGAHEPDSWYGIYDWFKSAYAITYGNNKLNELLSNALYDPEKCYDTGVVPELRNMNPAYGGPGIDMLWTNIKRGREFGLPWYSQVREFCGMGYLDDFSQLEGAWSQHCLNTVPKLVYNVKNVELYVGIVCENPLPGAVVGPTAACILQRQYQNLRESDRWFFDRNGFTEDQLHVIRKFSLGKILCKTTKLEYVTENVFRTPNAHSNKYVPCYGYDDVNDDDLNVLWTTNPYDAGNYRTCQ